MMEGLVITVTATVLFCTGYACGYTKGLRAGKDWFWRHYCYRDDEEVVE